jgi:hypothetical protein
MILWSAVVILLICIWGESVLFSMDIGCMTRLDRLIARFTHMYNIGIVFVMLYFIVSFLQTTPKECLTMATLLMFIGILTFVINVAFSKGVKR